MNVTEYKTLGLNYPFPRGLSEAEEKRCYATENGWILDKGLRTEEILICLKNLDVKIREQQKLNKKVKNKKTETLVEPIVETPIKKKRGKPGPKSKTEKE